ncbi:MAG: DUF4080 domain-containing protein [Treponemataceae bacterium]
MKTLLVAINTKFIHQNLAVRLLKANTGFACEYIEYTIKDDENEILTHILAGGYKIVAFSCYLWNLEIIKRLNAELRTHGIITIIGGIEVSYEYSALLDDFDYVIKGEGEKAFDHLLDSIINKKPLEYPYNIVTKNADYPIKELDLETLCSPYDQSYFDPNKIFYIETSRGCPYRCSYCMSSLEKKVRFFSLDFVFQTLDKIFACNVKTIKFLDRTFNVDNERAYKIIEYINNHAKDDQVFQFEVNLESLSDQVITLLNSCRPLFRLEVGIQTFNQKSLFAIDRPQNSKTVIQKMRQLKLPIIHADLIAGLPYEDLASFKKTFNTTIALYPQELQLGFLKLLKGTKIRSEACKYHYEFESSAPYEVIKNQFISQEDLAIIKKVEVCTKRVYNSGSFSRSMQYIIEHFDVFDFFIRLDVAAKGFHEVYLALYEFAQSENLLPLKESVVLDYFMHHNCKPKLIFNNLVYKPLKTSIIQTAYKNKVFENAAQANIPFNIDYMYRHAIVFVENTTHIIVYKDNKAYHFNLGIV